MASSLFTDFLFFFNGVHDNAALSSLNLCRIYIITEAFLKKHKHLPEISSAKEMEEKGIHLGEMNIKLLQKIEELTLYTIQQEKKIKKLESLNGKFHKLQSRLEKLESKN